MNAMQKLLGLSATLLLAAAVIGWWRSDLPPPAPARAAAENANLVDQSAYETSLRLQALANSAEQTDLAQSAARLADHDLDLAFTAALRRLDADPPVLDGAATQLAARLQKSQQLLVADQRRVTELTAALAQASAERHDDVQDELDLTKSQLELDQYEIDEGNQDLEDAGGNLRRRIVRQMEDRESAEKAHSVATVAAAPPATAAASARGLVFEFQIWRERARAQQQLASAQRAAQTLADGLSAERQALAATLEAHKGGIAGLAQHTKQARDASAPPGTRGTPAGGAALRAPTPASPTTAGRTHADTRVLVEQTARTAASQQVLTLLDQRVRAQRSLSRTYQQWAGSVARQTRAAAHALFAGGIIILAMLLVLLSLDSWLQRLFRNSKRDRRRVETLRSVLRVALQVLAVLVVIFMLTGLPSQFGTVLGIVGAGLTVALKDFIVAFIGWVVLMGRNGMRLGDWVEINGVSGEVCELGMFHTVLLETGNWGDAGHPTGRRVTFTNSFAIEGHYFNFSTSGQWLWDELQLVIPAGRDPHPIIEAIRQRVLEATAESARHAEQEWQRAVPGQSARLFSGVPGVSVKPVVGGVELTVRYITRASDRFHLRATLYQAAVDLLGADAHRPAPP